VGWVVSQAARVGRAYETLNRQLASLAVRGRRVRCQEHDGHLWLSDDQVDRAIAVTLCYRCEVARPCDDLARAIPASFGVWSGVYHTPYAAQVEGESTMIMIECVASTPQEFTRRVNSSGVRDTHGGDMGNTSECPAGPEEHAYLWFAWCPEQCLTGINFAAGGSSRSA